MNENDGRDREVLDYVRNRMATDMPPEFTRDVMNDVHRTTQRRRDSGWPMFAGLATVAAAVAAVIIGLGLVNQDPVSTRPTPSASATAEATPGLTPGESISPSPTAGDGEFGPIHSMAPDDAFAEVQTCENSGALTTTGEPSEISYSISFPLNWYTNTTQTETHSPCMLFQPESFEGPGSGFLPDEEAAIIANLPPGGDYNTDGATGHSHFTVDGMPAERYKFPAIGDAFPREPMVLWIVAIAGNMPAEGNDQPYLLISTHSSDPAELAAWADVLDRMVATLDIGE